MDSSDPSGAGGVGYWRAEAGRWRAEAEALAGCVVEAQRLAAAEAVLRARVADLEGQVCALTEKVSVLAKLAFGKSSEKKKARPTPDDEGAGGEGSGEGPVGGEPERRARGQRKGSRGHGRRS